AFTSSDFGRTFPNNGSGSDHGWGSHHLIMGGAVKGRKTYGKWPTLAINGPDDTNTGRWIPTTACDQYFATLATWFGLDNNYLSTVSPIIGRFSTPILGFLGRKPWPLSCCSRARWRLGFIFLVRRSRSIPAPCRLPKTTPYPLPYRNRFHLRRSRSRYRA